MDNSSLLQKLAAALAARMPTLSEPHLEGARLFAGHYEGFPGLVVDLYASTLLLSTSMESDAQTEQLLAEVRDFYMDALPWLTCVVEKQRTSKNQELRRGKIPFGQAPAQEILEDGIRYALDLRLNQDASFYLDTRLLRGWLKENSRGKTVLNSFAYTGSLGVAALAGNCSRVTQVDLNHNFLDLARRSAMLNRFDLGKMKLRSGDVFSEVGRWKHENNLFDLVILDPPFFSVTQRGRVDLVNESVRMINKLRPLISDGGRLVAINNALYLSGQEYWQALQELCRDGYMEIETTIPVPQDVTGFPATICSSPPTDPAPFNHPTKIAILSVRRK